MRIAKTISSDCLYDLKENCCVMFFLRNEDRKKLKIVLYSAYPYSKGPREEAQNFKTLVFIFSEHTLQGITKEKRSWF